MSDNLQPTYRPLSDKVWTEALQRRKHSGRFVHIPLAKLTINERDERDAWVTKLRQASQGVDFWNLRPKSVRTTLRLPSHNPLNWSTPLLKVIVECLKNDPGCVRVPAVTGSTSSHPASAGFQHRHLDSQIQMHFRTPGARVTAPSGRTSLAPAIDLLESTRSAHTALVHESLPADGGLSRASATFTQRGAREGPMIETQARMPRALGEVNDVKDAPLLSSPLKRKRNPESSSMLIPKKLKPSPIVQYQAPTTPKSILSTDLKRLDIVSPPARANPLIGTNPPQTPARARVSNTQDLASALGASNPAAMPSGSKDKQMTQAAPRLSPADELLLAGLRQRLESSREY